MDPEEIEALAAGESRSLKRRRAVQRGEPIPDFARPNAPAKPDRDGDEARPDAAS